MHTCGRWLSVYTHLCPRPCVVCAYAAVSVFTSTPVSLSVHHLGIRGLQTRLVLCMLGGGTCNHVLSARVFVCVSQACVFACTRRCVSVSVLSSRTRGELWLEHRSGKEGKSGRAPAGLGVWGFRLKGKHSPKVRILRARGT